MVTHQYRLASSVIDDDNNRTKQPRRTVNDGQTNTNTVFLSGKKKTGKVSGPVSSTPRWWLVVPCLILITLASAPDLLILNDFIVRRYERQYGLDVSDRSQRTTCHQSSTSTPDYWYLHEYSSAGTDYNIVQQNAAKFNVKNSFATLIPSLFAIVLLGSNCDTIGRRPLLFLPFTGKVVRYSLMLIIIAHDLPDGWLMVAHACEALFGSFGIVMLSALAYITDCTHESKRTRPFLIAEVVTLVARVVPVLAVGLWLQHFLYTIPTSVCLGLSVIGMLYVLFIQPESVQNMRNKSLILQITSIRLQPIIHCIQVFLTKRPGHNQQHLLLISITNILLLLMLFGYMSMFSLFAYGRPFCMNALDVGLLATTHAISACLFTLIISLLGKQQLDKSYSLPIIGLLALVGDLLLFGLAKSNWLLYMGAFIGSFFFITMPILRSKLSRLVEPHEYAIVFIAAAFIEAGGDKAMEAVSNAIYNASLHFLPGLVFLVLALLGLFPLLIMSYLAFSEKKTIPIISTINNIKV
ncbi:unnamed protein product [Adineta ricciae]|uniref:Major facilitator superfamily (MFS) profile domain-containing protein n=1 Tax=Adineta ricciae TaxID=249248 RepID=A0A814VR70_ADIRI|nr:unnamed protein product [Adineta ricciae]CAF1573482.1 unnamed protein product [Adineta ricciae]